MYIHTYKQTYTRADKKTYIYGNNLLSRWQRCIGCLMLKVSFCKRAIRYRVLLRKMTHQDKASYASWLPCIKVSLAVLGLETAPRCNTLQHAATCCNTLQHTATHPSIEVLLAMLSKHSQGEYRILHYCYII